MNNIKYRQIHKKYRDKIKNNFNSTIKMEIYCFLKDIFDLSIIGAINFTAFYKTLSIKSFGLTQSEHMHLLVPFQLKLYLNFNKLLDLQKSRWMKIENVFDYEDKAFVNEEKREEFFKLLDEHKNLCKQLFCFVFRKIEVNLKKITDKDFLKMIVFFREKMRDFEDKIFYYCLISSKNYHCIEHIVI